MMKILAFTRKFLSYSSLLLLFSTVSVFSGPLSNGSRDLVQGGDQVSGNIALATIFASKLSEAVSKIWSDGSETTSVSNIEASLPNSFKPGDTLDETEVPLFVATAEEGIEVGIKRIKVLEKLTTATNKADKQKVVENFRATGGKLKAGDIDYFDNPFTAEDGKYYSVNTQGYTDLGTFNPVLALPTRGITEYFDGQGISAMPLCGIEPGPFNVGRAAGFCPKGKHCSVTKTGNTVNVLLSPEGTYRIQVIRKDVNTKAACKRKPKTRKGRRGTKR